ncbi:ABC-2 type transport system permease protein [Kineosphaera limosa]|uniref:ABC transporter permease protein n=1 Tax=Kineosphaera limosa NBRC 100340 TaxID=1184609 RepID=K6W8G5_9MICO|nr:ABC transporter permease subunit [Kineosphaera limosa]NYE01337.1 ABC-2 type transport system permease protein [Kineosphaera limosa]GAB95490.1 hypothetical protein KILIM_021_00300 [Kineosphaera limosa NBRC 100340]
MNPTIARLAVYALLGAKRVWALLAFPVFLLVIAFAMRTFAQGSTSAELISGLAYPVLLPLVALLATSSVLGPEVDDGSIVYLLAKPVNRYVVAFSKFVVAWVATLLAGVLPLPIAGYIVDGMLTRGTQAWAIGGVVAATAYCALFLALAAVTRYAVVFGLLFVLLWEGALGGLLGGIAWVSVRQWGARIAENVDRFIVAPDLPLAYAFGAALVVTVGGLWWAGDRLRSFTVRGEA